VAVNQKITRGPFRKRGITFRSTRTLFPYMLSCALLFTKGPVARRTNWEGTRTSISRFQGRHGSHEIAFLRKVRTFISVLTGIVRNASTLGLISTIVLANRRSAGLRSSLVIMSIAWKTSFCAFVIMP
jgi:hypothetical protein